MAEWKVHRGFLDSNAESSDTSAQPQAPLADDAAAPGQDPNGPRIEDDPLVELARIVSESAANLGRLGTQPGDEPTLILGRATPKPLPLRPESGVGSGGPGTAPGYVSRATPTLSSTPSAHPYPPIYPMNPSAPVVEPPSRGGNPLDFEDDFVTELRQSVDPRVGAARNQEPRPEPRAESRVAPRAEARDDIRPAPARPFGAPAAPPPSAGGDGRLAAMRAAPRPIADEPTARVAQVVQSAMAPSMRPPQDHADDDGGPTMALNLRGGVPRPGAAPAPRSTDPLEDGFDDLFADSAPTAGATGGPRLTAGQAAVDRDVTMPRLGDNFPRPAADPAGRPHGARPKTGARGRPTRPEPRRSAVGAGLFIAASVLSVVILAGLGYLGYRTYAGSVLVSNGVPVIKAVGKIKEEPVARPTGDTAAPRLAADRVEDQTKLVTKSEEPVDQVSVGPRRITAGAPGTVVPQPAGDQPRTVKTVVVRPDGTVVQQTTPAPAPTPVRTQPINPAGDSGPLIASAPQTMPVAVAPAPKDPIGQQIGTPSQGAALQAAPPAPTKPAAPVTAAAPAPRLVPTPLAPLPAPAATTRPTASVGAPMAIAPQQPAASPPPAPFGQVQPRLAATPAPVAPSPPSQSAGSGDYMVQLSSLRTDAEARQSFNQAQSKYPALAGKALDIQRIDLGSRGTFYRARVAGGSQDQAASLCSQIKASGGDCLVAKR